MYERIGSLLAQEREGGETYWPGDFPSAMVSKFYCLGGGEEREGKILRIQQEGGCGKIFVQDQPMLVL